MISWYYFEQRKQREQNVTRPYDLSPSRNTYLLPKDFYSKKSPKVQVRSLPQQDMRIMYKDIIKNSRLLSPELKNSQVFLNDFMNQEKFFTILNNEKLRLQKIRQRNSSFVFKPKHPSPNERIAQKVLSNSLHSTENTRLGTRVGRRPPNKSQAVSHMKKSLIRRVARSKLFQPPKSPLVVHDDQTTAVLLSSDGF